jgi:hypothetical protein
MWPSNLTTVYVLKEHRTSMLKKYLFYVYCSIFHSSLDIKSTQISMHGWTDKENVCVWTVEYSSATKKGEIIFIYDNLSEPGWYFIK